MAEKGSDSTNNLSGIGPDDDAYNNVERKNNWELIKKIVFNKSLSNCELQSVLVTLPGLFPDVSAAEQKHLRLRFGLKLLEQNPSVADLCCVANAVPELSLEAAKTILDKEGYHAAVKLAADGAVLKNLKAVKGQAYDLIAELELATDLEKL